MEFPIGFALVGLVVLQCGILAILLTAVRRENTAAVVNALAVFVATLLPLAVEVAVRVVLGRTVSLGSALPLWIAVAGCLHAYGMLGPYDSIWWWDLLTHAVSAALVAALAYAAFLVTSTSGIAAVSAIALTFIVGIGWELIELVAREVGERYDVEPVLVHYGWRDTAIDLVVDVVAAMVIVLADVRVFVPIAEQLSGVVGVMAGRIA